MKDPHAIFLACTTECASFYQGILYAPVFVVAAVQCLRIRSRSPQLSAQLLVRFPSFSNSACVQCCSLTSSCYPPPYPHAHYPVVLQFHLFIALFTLSTCSAAPSPKAACGVQFHVPVLTPAPPCLLSAVRTIIDQLFAFGVVQYGSGIYFILYAWCGALRRPMLHLAAHGSAWVRFFTPWHLACLRVLGLSYMHRWALPGLLFFSTYSLLVHEWWVVVPRHMLAVVAVLHVCE